jgi:hypothetical protein
MDAVEEHLLLGSDTPDRRQSILAPSIPSRSSTISSTSSASKGKQQEQQPTDQASIAQVLKNMQLHYLSGIRPKDYCHHHRSPSSHDPISRATIFNSLISKWVVKGVSSPQDFVDRGERMKWFVILASECRRIHDFGSYVAIASAVVDPALGLTKLVAAKQHLERTSAECLNISSRFKDFMSPAKEHKVYKQELHKAMGKRGCHPIPWLSVHLSELETAHAKPDLIHVSGHVCIDFQRCAEIAHIVDTLHQLPQPPAGTTDELTSAGSGSTYVYVRDQLRSAFSVNSQALEARLEGLEKEEVRAVKGNVAGMRRAGFRVDYG